jgi:hypothetical protein
MVRSRDKARAAALAAEVVALRATVTELHAELARVRAEAAAAVARAVPVEITEADPRWVTLQMPLVKLALGDPTDVTTGPDVAAALASPDRSADTVQTEIVLQPTPAPADKMAWSVLANLPERPLLDPRADRDQEPRDVARPESGSGRETAAHRRTA